METKATVVGTIKLIGDTQTFDSGFSKREVVITSSGQYPKDIKVEFTKEKCMILDNYQVGQAVEVECNINGSEYNGKYYVSLVAWKINASSTDAPTPTPQPIATPSALGMGVSDEPDDLPF